jgi:hypothetical protein
MNSYDGRVKANAAIVPAGNAGAISVYVTDIAHVILDINGYFLPANDPSAPLAFFPLPPCRVVDTRNSSGPLGGPSMSAQQARSFPILSSSCNLPATARAYSLNFTAVPQGPLGYLTTWPTGMTQPLVSTLNALTGTVTANAAIVPAGNGGAISVYVTNNIDLVIDINGYFAASTSTTDLSLYALPPCRVLDTRQTGGAFSGQISKDTTASGCGIPPNAKAVVLNATVLPAQNILGYLTLWPNGEAMPLASTLNALDGQLTSNMAIVPTSSSGVIDAYATDPTQLILDTSGYFANIGSMAGSWDFTAALPGTHPVALEGILTQDSNGNISATGSATASGPAGNVFQADILGSSLSAATDIAVDYLGDTCGTDNGTRSATGTINSSNQVSLTLNGGDGNTVTVTGTLNTSATPPFSGTFTVSAPGCKSDGETGPFTGTLATSLTGTYSGTNAADSTDAITVTVTEGANGSFTGSGTSSKKGPFTVTGNAVGNAFSATVTQSTKTTSEFGYYDPKLGSKGSILLVEFVGGNATTCPNGVPIDNGSCLIAILAKQ